MKIGEAVATGRMSAAIILSLDKDYFCGTPSTVRQHA